MARNRQIAYDRRDERTFRIKVLADLWRAAGQPEAALEAITLTGAEPALPSSFAIGTAAQATVAASALAANELWHLRTGRRQRVSVDMRHAGIEFRSERYLRIDGKPPHEHRDKTVGVYRTGDGRWIRLHTNLPHHRAGTLKLLGADYDRASVQRAIDGWEAFKLEDAAAAAGLVVTATRSFEEWDAHPQGARGGGSAAVHHRADRRRAAAAAACRATVRSPASRCWT